MSSMHTMDQFQNPGIQELSFDEIEAIAGGPISIIAAYYAIGIVGTLYVGAQAALASMRLGYAANRN